MRRRIRAARLETLAYTVEEAAAVVGVGRDLLYDEIRTGRLKSKKAGARRVIAWHHLLDWLDGDTGESDRRAS
ncbi:MAG TPA: helix-turn-helix domain-containing protein [Streptosporangiaceae bacterium]|nr:helix-turn-helix domain-containing protein [Streptosporangiaceae bacterium]